MNQEHDARAVYAPWPCRQVPGMRAMQATRHVVHKPASLTRTEDGRLRANHTRLDPQGWAAVGFENIGSDQVPSFAVPAPAEHRAVRVA
jgi:hypothetical protein